MPPGSFEAWVSDISSPRVLRVDLSTGQATSVDSGVPLSRLLASPAVDVSGVTEKLPAGAFVYGIGASGPEVMAFDATTGTVASPLTDNGQIYPCSCPMCRCPWRRRPRWRRRSRSPGTTTARNRVDVPILLLVPLLDGSIAYIDGFRMRPLDVAGQAHPATAVAANPSLSALDSNGNQNGEVNYTIPVIASRPNPAFDPATPRSKRACRS